MVAMRIRGVWARLLLLHSASLQAQEDTRVPFSAQAVEMGVYQYRVMIGERVATGRLIVQ